MTQLLSSPRAGLSLSTSGPRAPQGQAGLCRHPAHAHSWPMAPEGRTHQPPGARGAHGQGDEAWTQPQDTNIDNSAFQNSSDL